MDYHRRVVRVILWRVDDEPADLIDVRAAAKLLGVSRTTVYAAIERGQLTAYERPLDGHVKVREADVRALGRFRRRRRPNGESKGLEAG
jgi:excisionase family DNA binding protein